MRRPKFDMKEAFFLYMQAGKSGFPKPFIDALLEKISANTDWTWTETTPTKRLGKDEKRALVVASLQEKFPDMKVGEAIAHGRLFASIEKMIEAGQEPWAILARSDPPTDIKAFRKLFPKSNDLRSSVSRGRAKLRDQE